MARGVGICARMSHPKKTHTHIIIPIRIFTPSPPDGILDFEFDEHAPLLEGIGLGGFLFFMFGTDIGVGMKRFGVEFDEIGHSKNPILCK